METADFLVIGGGVVGLAAARELKRRHPDSAVVLLEKEPSCGEHASGRNSGILHAGFYYSADSLKSRLCRDGNRRLREFCAEKGLPVNACGKLVIPRGESEDRALDELFRRAKASGVEVESWTRRPSGPSSRARASSGARCGPRRRHRRIPSASSRRWSTTRGRAASPCAPIRPIAQPRDGS